MPQGLTKWNWGRELAGAATNCGAEEGRRRQADPQAVVGRQAVK